MAPSDEPIPRAETSGVDASVRDAAWDVLVSDPTAGLLIATEAGDAIYCNDRAAELYLGEGAKGPQCLGVGWASHLPPAAIEHRRRVFQDVKASGRPAMVRTIFDGRQTFALIFPVPTKGTEPARFVILLRTVPGNGSAQSIAAGLPLIETESIDLGPLSVLSPREIEVLALVGQSLSSREIANVLHRSEKTVENHRYSISKKLEGANAQQLAALARRAGLTAKDAHRIHRDPLPKRPT